MMPSIYQMARMRGRTQTSNMSSIDIIVPCYRYGRYLRECVSSILTQSVSTVRVLIINDASPDNTGEVAKELVIADSRVSYLEHASNKGHIYTYNEGTEWASADYLLLLSADDYLLPGALYRAIALMQNNPEVGLTFGNAIETTESGKSRQTDCIACERDIRIMSGREFISFSGPRNLVPTPTAVVRTVLQKKLGGYRKDLPHTGDMELWLRLAAHAPVGFIRTPQAVYRRHGSNMSLSYSAQRFLPDLEQRKAALDYFFQSCEHIITNSAEVQEALLYSLALDAVGFASEAFNHDEQAQVNQLSAFAISTFPKIKASKAWAKLSVKRFIGVNAWHAFLIAIRRVLQLIDIIARSKICSLLSNRVVRSRESQGICKPGRFNRGQVA